MIERLKIKILINWALPQGSGYALQSVIASECGNLLNIFISKLAIPGFPLLSLTQNAVLIRIQPKIEISNKKSKVRYLWRFKKSFPLESI